MICMLTVGCERLRQDSFYILHKYVETKQSNTLIFQPCKPNNGIFVNNDTSQITVGIYVLCR